MEKKILPQFLHKKFLADNKIEVKELSIELQEMVGIFEDFLTQITKPDHEQDSELLIKLVELDKDIYDHALTEFEFNLEHCEVCEKESKKEEKPQPKEPVAKTHKPEYKKGAWVEITGGKPRFIGEVAKVVEYHPSGANSKARDTLTLESNKFPYKKAVYSTEHVTKTDKKPSAELKGDEKILDNFFTIGRTKKIKRSTLKELGLQSELTGWEISIGPFVLKRSSIFSYVYSLEKQAEKTNAG